MSRLKAILRVLPLALLGIVLVRERPWTVELSAAAPWAIVASVVLNLVLYLPLKAARWRVALDEPPPFGQVLAATVEGLLANAALGFGSGDVVRAARLRWRGTEGTQPTQSAQAKPASRLVTDYGRTWAERGAEALALALLVGAGALVADLGHVALGVAALVLVGYAALLVAGRALVPRLSRWPRVRDGLAAGLHASTPRNVAVMALLSLVGWAGELGMLMLFQHAFGIPIELRTALITLIGINAAIAIPAVPGNFGTFEAGAAAGLVACGVGRDVALAYALTYHLSHVLPVAVLATVVALVRARGRRTTGAVERAS